MLTQDYLNLRLTRLQPPEEWTGKGDGISFVFPKGGVGQYSSGAETGQLVPGDVLALNAALGGKLCVPRGSEMVFQSFSLCIEHLFPLFACEEICLLRNITDSFTATRHYPASSPLARECCRLLADVPPQFNLDHRGQLLRVAAAILSAEFSGARRRRAGFIPAEDHMIQVFESLSAAEILTLPVGGLAGKFGCSRRHLNRLFHQHFGFSVAALKMEMRLLKAVSLLRDPGAKVSAVAVQCGFNHLGLFNTCFKRRFGASPSHWRKSPDRSSIEIRPVGLGLLGDGRTCSLLANGLCPWSDKSAPQNPPGPEAPRIRSPGTSRGATCPPSREVIAGIQPRASIKVTRDAGSAIKCQVSLKS